MKKSGIKKIILKLSEGLLATVTDLLLLQFFLIGSSLGKGKTSRGAYLVIQEAAKNWEEINYRTLKQAFFYLKRKGLIRSLLEPSITALGRKRLKKLMPQYQSNRPWDGVIYLITYDIPETKKIFRDKLRLILNRIGAGYLQGSVWITPYNPQQILKEFSHLFGFEGEIIVSCIGKDGYIGNESLNELLNRVYRLEEINNQYGKFLDKYRKLSLPSVDKWKAAAMYLSILKQDPQLPDDLLPDNWRGNKAYQVYLYLTKKGS
ncbi:MAG: hypothetical protein UV54_C0016G0008 [Candidatus Beckwithbacteria bacterium GW2011_GWA2_43_10]|uniref:Uncharacterized protein n=1 Tax=Candidatus Beckwithbacteria bacterium GW2011_GWA2_43_10 TaxID=1618369 RepID=A0A0G1EZU9_9BACT|nr:MAG: hypothetical protein UV54_C0016G0008 [Candidatus Beckwithbacteria bacterium GW2011_GWA2_43_10]